MQAETSLRSATQKPASRWGKGRRNGLALGAAAVLGTAGFILAPSQAAQAAAQGFTYDSAGSITLVYACNSNKEYLNVITVLVDNVACTGRVWLHQHMNGSGWSYCISGGAFANLAGTKYASAGNLLATKVIAPCP